MESWHTSLNFLYGVDLFQPFDPVSFRVQFGKTTIKLQNAEANGDLSAVVELLTQMRTADDAFLSRPTTKMVFGSAQDVWREAYQNGHWNVIEYLAQQPDFNVVPPLLTSRWEFAPSVAERALETDETSELQRLFDLGWDINQCGGWAPISRIGKLNPPTLQ